jgi:hypothetical protein
MHEDSFHFQTVPQEIQNEPNVNSNLKKIGVIKEEENSSKFSNHEQAELNT